LAKTLKIPPHDDVRLVLKAALDIVEQKFTPEAIAKAKENANTETKVTEADLSQFPLGFDTGGRIL
jgi:hypothetical protein